MNVKQQISENNDAAIAASMCHSAINWLQTEVFLPVLRIMRT